MRSREEPQRRGDRVPLAAALVLTAVLGSAGATKLRTPVAFRTVLRQILPSRTVPTLALAIPLAELAVSATLASGQAPRLAATLSIILLTGFSGALLAMWRRGASLDCGCFGEAREARSPTSGTVRNALLIVLAVFVLLTPEKAVAQATHWATF